MWTFFTTARNALANAFRYAPTLRLAAAVFGASVLWLFSSTETGMLVAVIGCVAIALVTVVDAVLIPSRHAISVTRTLPATLGAGDEAAGAYRIASRVPITFTLHHALPVGVMASLPTDTRRTTPERPTTISFSITGKTRGTYPLGPIAIAIRSPFGLVRRSLVYRPDDVITVVPSIAGIRRYRLLAIQHRLKDTGQRVLRRRGSGTAFSNLREYVPGDDPRHIDWKASARHQRLIAREFTVEQGQTVMIAIDAGRMMTQLVGDRPRFEYALSSALVLADIALQSGDRVGVMVFNEEVRRYVAPARGAAALAQIRDALAGTAATLTEPDYAAAFRTLLTHHRRRSLIVLFTDVIDPRSSRAVTAHTTRSAIRHLPLVVALRNEQLAEAAIPTVRMTDETAYATVAAEELLSARSEVLLGMRQAGVSVIDTPPMVMTAALINQYLEIKRRALL